jgi:hypothetical protein
MFKNMINESIVIDKVDMHIALELATDLIELGKYNVKPLFKTIITTNVSSESEGSYVDIKKAFFGDNKALVI